MNLPRLAITGFLGAARGVLGRFAAGVDWDVELAIDLAAGLTTGLGVGLEADLTVGFGLGLGAGWAVGLGAGLAAVLTAGLAAGRRIAKSRRLTVFLAIPFNLERGWRVLFSVVSGIYCNLS